MFPSGVNFNCLWLVTVLQHNQGVNTGQIEIMDCHAPYTVGSYECVGISKGGIIHLKMRTQSVLN